MCSCPVPGKVARLPSTPGMGGKPAVAMLWVHTELRTQPQRHKDILLALSVFVPFEAVYTTIASHQFGEN